MSEKDPYKDCKTKTERWKVELLGDYALKKLLEIYDPERINKFNPLLSNYSGDKRRIPTVRRSLEDEHLIFPSYNTNDSITFIPDAIEKILPGFSKEPEFDTKGYIVKREYSSLPPDIIPLKNRGDLYRKINNFNAYEAIHIYLNQKDYDFRIFKTTYIHQSKKSFSGHSTTEYFSLKVFPLKLIQEADKNILDANINDYIKNHAGEILTETFETPFNCIGNDKPFLSQKEVTERLNEVRDKIRHLQYVEKELTTLETKFIEKGNKECTKTILEKGYEYVRERSPLWITDENNNKELAMMILKGVPLLTENTIHR